MSAVASIASKYAFPAVDRSHDQAELDLNRRSRTSLFPWRGQFSPELVEVLLRDLPSEGLIVDPFVGSGTTLFEAGRLGISGLGAEINPAALSFAVLSELASEPLSRRIEVTRIVSAALQSQRPEETDVGGLFETTSGPGFHGPAVAKAVLSELCDCPKAADVFRAAVVLAMGQKSTLDLPLLTKEVGRVRRLLEGLPEASGGRRVVAADARRLPLGDGAAVAAITSPPYINVFNYHQHYRPAVELMGAGPLVVARSEIGSNRKHRQNRFLTVVQYALDMADALLELRRVLVADGVAKIVVGRESNVRGVAFRNGQLIAALAEGSGAFVVERWQERRFTSRFGESIFEDLLTLRRTSELNPVEGFTPRAAGVWALDEARHCEHEPDVRSDLDAAVAKADSVLSSPLFDEEAIPWMQARSKL